MKFTFFQDFLMTKAIHDFSGENPGELHFSVGDVIQVLREIDSNWSEGRINDVSGMFPTAFVEIQPPASKGKKSGRYNFEPTSLASMEYIGQSYWKT
jgi:hypothetical protein